jgi:protein-L-isoaspartate(D-aspartate) O-methyltransferase
VSPARWIAVAVLALGCRKDREKPAPVAPTSAATSAAPDAGAPATDDWAAQRAALVEALAAEGLDRRVLAAIGRVPRHELVPEEERAHAYEDRALSIGFDQTISQPFVVAMMTEAAQVGPGSRVLEVGTGSGYQAAVLAELGAEVYSIEIVEPLAERTAELLARLGYEEINLQVGDGYRGWPEMAPFDAILVTAAPPEVPKPLLEQLDVDGRLVIPVGEVDAVQELRVITRTADGTTSETLAPVRFVPMTGEAQGAQ